jgi:predicted RNase H-like HicB family nuclease
VTVRHEVTVPYTVEQDEDGMWAAQAALTPDAFANGQGETREAAIDDLREALVVLAEAVGVPDQLTVTVEAD